MNIEGLHVGEISAGRQERSGDSVKRVGSQTGFEDLLRSQLGQGIPVRFSAHAQQRMEAGGLNLDEQALWRLERAVSVAGEKGSKDALVLMDDLALLVSISNRTVITAVDQSRQKSGVFTHIDSVVMA